MEDWSCKLHLETLAPHCQVLKGIQTHSCNVRGSYLLFCPLFNFWHIIRKHFLHKGLFKRGPLPVNQRAASAWRHNLYPYSWSVKAFRNMAHGPCIYEYPLPVKRNLPKMNIDWCLFQNITESIKKTCLKFESLKFSFTTTLLKNNFESTWNFTHQ